VFSFDGKAAGTEGGNDGQKREASDTSLHEFTILSRSVWYGCGPGMTAVETGITRPDAR
jgi:hypothetical protein